MLVKIISTMLANTYTTDDLIERIGLMRKYYGIKLFVPGKEQTGVHEVLAPECEPHTLEALQIWEQGFMEGSVQPIAVYEALDTVQEELAGMPSVRLYVPVRFGPKDVERFGQWFRANVQPNILLSLHVDPRTTGGCGFIWNNVYHDFSLHYHVERQRDKVVAMLDTHTHVS